MAQQLLGKLETFTQKDASGNVVGTFQLDLPENTPFYRRTFQVSFPEALAWTVAVLGLGFFLAVSRRRRR